MHPLIPTDLFTAALNEDLQSLVDIDRRCIVKDHMPPEGGDMQTANMVSSRSQIDQDTIKTTMLIVCTRWLNTECTVQYVYTYGPIAFLLVNMKLLLLRPFVALYVWSTDTVI